MAWYEASADFQRDYYKRRKLAGRSPGNDGEVSTTSVFHIIEYGTEGLVRSENEATILCIVEKRLYFAVQWCTLFKNLRPRYTRRYYFPLFFLAALRAVQHSLYTSDFPPTPMRDNA